MSQFTPEQEKEFEFRLRYEQEQAAKKPPVEAAPEAGPDAASEAANTIVAGGAGALSGALARNLPQQIGNMVKDPVTGKWMAVENYARQMSQGKYYGGKNFIDVWDRIRQVQADPAKAAAFEAEVAAKGPGQAAKILSKTPGPLKPVLTAPMGFLGRGVVGAGAGIQGADAYNRFERGDIPGAVISGLGSLGTAASMIPHPVTRIGGTAIGLGAEGLNAFLDYLKQKSQKPQTQPLQAPQPKQMAKGGSAKKKMSKAERAAKAIENNNKKEKFAGGGHATPAWQRSEGKNPEGGLNAAGRASYNRETGGNLKPPVSAEAAKSSPKKAARRKSFCARMSGNPGPMKDEKGRPTRKALALRKWDC